MTQKLESLWSFTDADIASVASALSRGGCAVIPTDTIYGVVASAQNADAVECLYTLRKRDVRKPMIVLIDSLSRLDTFGVTVDDQMRVYLTSVWPGPTSVILDISGGAHEYLHRGTNTLAFRMPAQESLQKLLGKIGPIVAPSANLEGKIPARTIAEAQDYFGDLVSCYIDKGPLQGAASRIVRYTGGAPIVLRERNGYTEK